MPAGVRWLLLAAAAAPFAYYAAAIFCAWTVFRKREAAAEFLPPLSILRPMRGVTPRLYESLASLCRQDYPRYEVLFCADDPLDPAVPLIQRLLSEFPQSDIRLLTGSSVSGSNNKINKVCALANEARYDLLAVSDGDVRVDPDYLRRVAAPFADPRVGVVTCLYRGLAEPNLWSELEALSISTDLMAGVLVARALGVNFALGATMGVRQQALAQIGGFEALADVAADDHELGSRVARVGYRVELARTSVQTECGSRRLLDFLQHQLRWAVVTRTSRPWGHFGLIFAQGLPWTIFAAVLAPSGVIASAYILAYLALRLGVAFVVGHWGLRDPLVLRRWWFVPLEDCFSLLIWLASLFTRRIVWQGAKYDIRKGRLIPVRTRMPETVSPPPSKGSEAAHKPSKTALH